MEVAKKGVVRLQGPNLSAAATAKCRQGATKRGYGANFFFSSSFTCAGLALPWVAFITAPTK